MPVYPKRSRIRLRRDAPRRTSVLRCREYLDWLHERACVACTYHRRSAPGEFALWLEAVGIWARLIDPAHGPPAGVGMKGSDDGAVPLCRWHHDEQDRLSWSAFEAKYGFSRETEAAAHWAAFQADKENR